eukprot:GEMP01024365.1.p1 GENE.GEMP01024365.1~~GEMP01024365.1.p1  ORF type:complete len:180 (+),score=23.83 GEMP01024365.1:124-663(+)
MGCVKSQPKSSTETQDVGPARPLYMHLVKATFMRNTSVNTIVPDSYLDVASTLWERDPPHEGVTDGSRSSRGSMELTESGIPLALLAGELMCDDIPDERDANHDVEHSTMLQIRVSSCRVRGVSCGPGVMDDKSFAATADGASLQPSVMGHEPCGSSAEGASRVRSVERKRVRIAMDLS